MGDKLKKRFTQIAMCFLAGGVAGVLYALFNCMKGCWQDGYIQDGMYVTVLLNLQDRTNQAILPWLMIGLFTGLLLQYVQPIMRRFGKSFLPVNTAMSQFLSRGSIVKSFFILNIIALLMINSAPALVRKMKSWSHRKEPNVILITVDALRADRVSCYGYSRDTTPNIDRLADRGILFKNAVVSAPVTLPSLTRLMASNLHTSEIISEKERTLPEALQNAGYSTAAIIRNPAIEVPFDGKSLRRGFDSFICPDDLGRGVIRQLYDADWRASTVTDRAIAWLRRNGKGKFFLWLHYFDPHDPYAPPPPYDSKFTSPGYSGPFDGDIRKTEEQNVKIFGEECSTLAPEDREYIIALYDGEVNYVDEQIGRFLRAVEDMGVEKNTIIVLTADHGESQGEHGMWTHGYSVYDQEILVPLIMAGPGLPHSVVEAQVELLDLAPTILGLLHRPVPGTMEGGNLLDSGRAGDPSQPGYAFIQYALIFAVRSQDAKLIQHGHTDSSKRIKEFYDLATDPGETRNIYSEEDTRAQELEDVLVRRISKDADAGEEYDTDIKEKLKSLGYLQ